MRLLPLIGATYFMVAGGPYGLEDIIGDAGYGRALLLLLLVPLVWSLPTSLMVGELASALPEEGGYYVLGAPRARRRSGDSRRRGSRSPPASSIWPSTRCIFVLLYLSRVAPTTHSRVARDTLGSPGSLRSSCLCTRLEPARRKGRRRRLSRDVRRCCLRPSRC
jgi:hypothetical protein